MKVKTRKQRFREIISASNKGLNSCVIELGESYLKQFPNSQGGWDLYSLALYRVDRFKDSKKALYKAIELTKPSDDSISWLFCRMAQIYEDSGHFHKAVEWFQKAIDLNWSEATFLIFKGVVLLRLEKHREAYDTLIKATKCKNGCIDEAFYNLGVACIAQRKYEEATIYFKKALEIDPKYKEAKQQLKDVTQVITILKNK